MIHEVQYPQLATLKDSEIFVESVTVVKDGRISTISIEKVILKKGRNEMERALKSQLAVDEVYLRIIET